MARALAIIPARYASSRFPGKPLASLSGKPVLQHVYERALRAKRLAGVIVATDDARIFDAVTAFGGQAIMTLSDHVSGSDRVAEVARRDEAAGVEIIVNVQGDQPLIDPAALDALVAVFDEDPKLEMATLYEPLASVNDLLDPNVAKVVSDRLGHALYFSRSPIPYYRHESPARSALATRFETDLALRPEGLAGYWKHVGVYAFRKAFLLEFGGLPQGMLESLEGLEQLRALESGHRIRLVRSAGVSLSVETPADLVRIQEYMTS